MTTSANPTPESGLPTPMRPEDFIVEFLDMVATTESGDEAGLTTMQIEAQTVDEESLVFDVISAMVDAKRRGVDARIIIDDRYVRNMTRVGNRDFPDWLPFLSKSRRSERAANQARTDAWLQIMRDEDVLVEAGPHVPKRGYVPRLRHIGSLHLAQPKFAVRHMKAAYVAKAEGDVTAWINSANLTDSDLRNPNPGSMFGMNNLSLRLKGKRAAFVVRAINQGFRPETGIHTYNDGVTIVHDINNSGEPARLPRILVEALEAVDPARSSVITDPNDCEPRSPQTIVLISQYPPHGLLFEALEHAATAKQAGVYVPLQPLNDHRETSFPYNINSVVFRKRVARQPLSSRFICDRRLVPSHMKCQIVTYDDGTAKLIIGSDNFVTHLQKVVRNEELAAVISVNGKNEAEAKWFHDTVNLLFEMGELSEQARDNLLQDVLRESSNF